MDTLSYQQGPCVATAACTPVSSLLRRRESLFFLSTEGKQTTHLDPGCIRKRTDGPNVAITIELRLSARNPLGRLVFPIKRPLADESLSV